MKIDKRFWIVIFIVLILWGSLFWFMIKYGESVRRDPCSICAERHGELVVCSTVGGEIYNRFYLPTGEITDNFDTSTNLSENSTPFVKVNWRDT